MCSKNRKHESLLKAVEEVRKGVSIRGAARQYGVSRSTLSDRVRVGYCDNKKSALFSKDEEHELCEWAEQKADIGMPQNRTQVINGKQIIFS